MEGEHRCNSATLAATPLLLDLKLFCAFYVEHFGRPSCLAIRTPIGGDVSLSRLSSLPGD